MLFSHVKISSFRAKAHLVFRWCLYNKKGYYLLQLVTLNLKVSFSISGYEWNYGRQWTSWLCRSTSKENYRLA